MQAKKNVVYGESYPTQLIGSSFLSMIGVYCQNRGNTSLSSILMARKQNLTIALFTALSHSVSTRRLLRPPRKRQVKDCADPRGSAGVIKNPLLHQPEHSLVSSLSCFFLCCRHWVTCMTVYIPNWLIQPVSQPDSSSKVALFTDVTSAPYLLVKPTS